MLLFSSQHFRLYLAQIGTRSRKCSGCGSFARWSGSNEWDSRNGL